MTHSAAPAFAHSAGPRDARIAIVGEAFGRDEAFTGMPFVGASGQELTRMLGEAGIERKDCFITNVLAFQPPANNLELISIAKSALPKGYMLPPLAKGKFLDPQYLGELSRLNEELLTVKPNVIIALGNTAIWYLFGSTNIGSIRGVVAASPYGKVLPTYHPASVLRQWNHRPIVVADLLKAGRESAYPEIRRSERQVIINPTLQEIELWAQRKAQRYAVDIETHKGSITCIGFARSAQDALVIPFMDTAKGGNYWAREDQELAAWAHVKALLEGPVEKIFQNGLYDIQYLMRMGFRPAACLHDTMLLQHSLYPEMKKGLGFLGSVHSNESAWKQMRSKKAAAVAKADDE